MTRLLTGTVRLQGTDNEDIGKNEILDVTRDISQPVEEDGQATPIYIEPAKWGGECRIEIYVTARCIRRPHPGEKKDDPNPIIVVEGVARLFEGDSEDTSDLDDERPVYFEVIKNGRNNPNMTEYFVGLNNSGLGGGDDGRITFGLRNVILEE